MVTANKYWRGVGRGEDIIECACQVLYSWRLSCACARGCVCVFHRLQFCKSHGERKREKCGD
jgi:hypothetical protein